MISYIDTNEVENIAKELSTLANDLEAEFNSLFDRFANVPTSTKEWTGTQAKYYFSKVAEEKPQYSQLVEQVRRISRELATEAADAQSSVSANNNRD